MFTILDNMTALEISKAVAETSDVNDVRAVTLTHVGVRQVYGARRNVFAAVVEYYPRDEDEISVTT